MTAYRKRQQSAGEPNHFSTGRSDDRHDKRSELAKRVCLLVTVAVAVVGSLDALNAVTEHALGDAVSNASSRHQRPSCAAKIVQAPRGNAHLRGERRLALTVAR